MPGDVLARQANPGGDRRVALTRDGAAAPGYQALVLPSGRPRLPLADGSVDLLRADGLIDGLDLPEATALLRECRRVLRRGGRLHLTVADLDQLLREVTSEEAWTAAGWKEAGYDFGQCRVERLNRALAGRRRWYDRGEIERLGVLTGLHPVAEAPGADAGGAEVGALSDGARPLALALEKPAREEGALPLVSIIIPLYRTTFLRQALASALDQSYPNIEVVITDDGDPRATAAVIAELAGHPRLDAIRHYPNPRRLGEAANYLECFARSRGPYVKYLNDDDVLAPRCVELMASCLRQYPEVTLVTSHRLRIDERDQLLPEGLATLRPAGVSSLIDGRSLVAEMLRNQVNLVGEPTTVMFRRADAERVRPNFWSFGGVNPNGNGDVTLWLNLLSQGDAVYLYPSLSRFRVHANQGSADPRLRPQALFAWYRAAEVATRMGLYDPAEDLSLSCRPLDRPPWWPEELRRIVDRGAGAAATDEALLQLGEAALARPDEPDLLARTAEGLLASGRWQEVLKLLTPALREQPEHQPLLLLLARALAAAGEQERGNKLLSRAHAVRPFWGFEHGLVGLEDGASGLAPDARLRVSRGLPACTLTLTLEHLDLPALGRAPLEIVVEASEGSSVRLLVTQPGARFDLVVPLGSPPAAGIIPIRWRGRAMVDLPPRLQARTLQIVGATLALGGPPSPALVNLQPPRTSP